MYYHTFDRTVYLMHAIPANDAYLMHDSTANDDHTFDFCISATMSAVADALYHGAKLLQRTAAL